MEERLGQRIGKYRLVRLLGQGGSASVYLGEHVFLETSAAIKILQMHLSSDELKDFLQEARTLAHLEHPHIVRVLDFGLEGNTPYFVMQYAPNASLRQRYPKGSILPLTSIISYIKQISSAVQYAHEQNLIHRDIKPENILLGRNEELLLGDFGVAVLTRNSHLSRPQEISGTIAYMAPEQLQGHPCPASDQYALGVIVYEWLCGSCPFQGSFAEIAQQHISAPPPSLRSKIDTISLSVEQAVLKALAKDPQQRFASVQDFASALEQASQAALPEVSVPPTPGRQVESEEKSAAHFSLVGEVPHGRPVWWNVPYRRNPFFTGREEILQHLYNTFHETKWDIVTQPLALCGLGGIGKTQTAIEYAHRYRTEYQAVLWAKADTYETLFTDFVAIARLLDLPEWKDSDHQHIAEALKQWLTVHSNWLLILDNVADLALLEHFSLPTNSGHILLTTRLQATASIARTIDLEKMAPDEGALFLLRRSKMNSQAVSVEHSIDADYIEARDISELVDGLPLALDQAGAYIEETRCSLSDYIDRYRQQRSFLLSMRGSAITAHPEPVTATWLLSFEKIEQSNPGAAELLKLCAFLHPDSILEEILIDAAPEFGEVLQQTVIDPFTLDRAIAELRHYSLVQRNVETKSLSIHRLVQTVVKDRMDLDEQRGWSERAVRAINRAFPAGDQVENWQRCMECLPHVQICVQLLEQWNIALPEAARLLDQAGLYLLEHARYIPAQFLLNKAFEMRLQLVGPDHLDVAESLNNLAGPYLYQGKYAQAEPLLQKALEIREQVQGPAHLDVAVSLNNLALLYNQQGKYALAEPLFQRALAIWEQNPGVPHSDAARTFSNLALLYQVQGKYAQAEPLYQRSLAIWEQIRGPEHPDVAVSLNNLALLYLRLGKDIQAETLFQRLLEIRERNLGPDHPMVAYSLNYLARLYQRQFKYMDAEILFRQALKIRKHALGPEHPDVAYSLSDLARLYSSQNKYAQAEPLFQQSLDIFEQSLGQDHPEVAVVLKNYAVLLSMMKRKDEAIQLILRAKAIHAK